MDRLFLAGLVRELAPVLKGGRVRSVAVDETGRRLTLALSSPMPKELVFHLGPGAPGVFLRDPLAPPPPGTRSGRAKKLTKWLASSVVGALSMSELDRVVTLTLERIRLSGKKKRSVLVFELLAIRTNLFAVDLESDHIVECLGVGGLRLLVGDRFVPLDPPRHAARPAADAEELEGRISGTSRDALLSATGWTPRLVEEMRYWMNEEKSIREAFEIVRERLLEPVPTLYVADTKKGKRRGRGVSLAPIELASERELVAHPMSSFNEAMTEAVRLTVDAERAHALEGRLETAASGRLKRLRALGAKLTRQKESLPAPEEWRRRGETLLSGLSRAKPVREGLVRVPDPFDVEGREIEIPIDPRVSLTANVERMFRRSRKAERTKIELRRRLEEVEQDIAYAEEFRTSLAGADTLEELESLEREAEDQGLLQRVRAHGSASRTLKRLPPRRFESFRGHVILVGRSARSNEEVTFRSSQPDDLWFHALATPGSHVVLRLPPNSRADPEEILEAASLAAHFSKEGASSLVEVMVTECRNVSKIKGAPPGLVKVQSYRTVRVRPRPVVVR